MILRDGTRMLVSDTVARPYVPDVDDVPEPVEEPDATAETEESEDKPKRTYTKRAGKG